MTPAAASLFHVTHLCQHRPPRLVGCAATDDYCIGPVSTLAQCEQALADCYAQGWLQIVDEATLARMAAEVSEAGLLGPVYDYPRLGAVDFTSAGARLWETIRNTCYGAADRTPFAYSDVVREKSLYYFRSMQHAERILPQLRRWYDNPVVTCSDPLPIGPWRVEWWRRFASGYVVEVTERRQWTGRASGGGENCSLDLELLGADRSQLRAAALRQQVSSIQWQLLNFVGQGWSHESAEDFCRSLVAIKGRRQPSWYSVDDIRAALDHAVNANLLRVVDQPVLAELAARDELDPATAVLPGYATPNIGQVTFTTSGAALYRRILEDSLGVAWEDALYVSRGTEWEAHHYCAAEAPFFGTIAEHQSRGEIVRGLRLVPIGPWCVKWWERFPDGYRLELDLSQADPHFESDQRAIAAGNEYRGAEFWYCSARK